MSRASRARGIAKAAAYGGGGLVGAGGAVFGLMVGQAQLARHKIGLPTEDPWDADGRYGDGPEPPVRLAILGDSGAAGLGVDSPAETTGAVLAQGLADASGRPVDFASFAVVGARSADLPPQVERALAFEADVVAIVVGANDVTHRVLPATSVRLLAAAVRELQRAGVPAVVGTCPDLGTVRPIPHPLRLVARSWSRSLAAAQSVGVVEAGGRTVALADLLGEEFAQRPDDFFGPDRFHPSATGYRAVALSMLPSALDVLGLRPEPDDGPQADSRVWEVAQVAAAAADLPGAEVSGATVSGQDRGRAGRWAKLRRAPSPKPPGAAGAAD
ncbi:MAG: SGNH/GDSL hydrolase family protein [Actinomycetota bacterium]|nr:SGNH/GDSL hydrolase family protein [Actinomycetota bacterium]